MSTRRGTAVLLSDILDEAKDRMVEKMSESKSRSIYSARLNVIL